MIHGISINNKFELGALIIDWFTANCVFRTTEYFVPYVSEAEAYFAVFVNNTLLRI